MRRTLIEKENRRRLPAGVPARSIPRTGDGSHPWQRCLESGYWTFSRVLRRDNPTGDGRLLPDVPNFLIPGTAARDKSTVRPRHPFSSWFRTEIDAQGGL
jgi:hypothetical protein